MGYHGSHQQCRLLGHGRQSGHCWHARFSSMGYHWFYIRWQVTSITVHLDRCMTINLFKCVPGLWVTRTQYLLYYSGQEFPWQQCWQLDGSFSWRWEDLRYLKHAQLQYACDTETRSQKTETLLVDLWWIQLKDSGWPFTTVWFLRVLFGTVQSRYKPRPVAASPHSSILDIRGLMAFYLRKTC